MTKDDLNGLEVNSSLEKVRGEGMAKSMGRNTLIDVSPLCAQDDEFSDCPCSKRAILLTRGKQQRFRVVVPPVKPQVVEQL